MDRVLTHGSVRFPVPFNTMAQNLLLTGVTMTRTQRTAWWHPVQPRQPQDKVRMVVHYIPCLRCVVTNEIRYNWCNRSWRICAKEISVLIIGYEKEFTSSQNNSIYSPDEIYFFHFTHPMLRYPTLIAEYHMSLLSCFQLNTIDVINHLIDCFL